MGDLDEEGVVFGQRFGAALISITNASRQRTSFANDCRLIALLLARTIGVQKAKTLRYLFLMKNAILYTVASSVVLAFIPCHLFY